MHDNQIDAVQSFAKMRYIRYFVPSVCMALFYLVWCRSSRSSVSTIAYYTEGHCILYRRQTDRCQLDSAMPALLCVLLCST